MSDIIKVKMLGRFSIECGGKSIDDSANRMRKVWLLLAYLIYNRERSHSQESFFSLLKGGSEDSADPNGRLKAMFYRARTMLGGLYDNAGHDMILSKGGRYSWNRELPITLDAEEFDSLCAAAAAETDEEARLNTLTRALELYTGGFLPKLDMEPWVMPISAYYHRLYLEAAEQALGILESREEYDACERVCTKALEIEPYSESLYQHLMQSRIALDNRAGAVTAYEDMCEILFSNFGVMPSDESRELYRLATREVGGSTVPAGTVREQLKEADAAKGALFCEYDFFRLLYQVQARSIARSGETIHIGLLSLHGHGNKALQRRSLDTAMDNLQAIIVGNLRQGDVVTKCSVSQFIVMLPQANYENSCMVCQRIIKAFNRAYPHSPAEIRFSVQPLEPLKAEEGTDR